MDPQAKGALIGTLGSAAVLLGAYLLKTQFGGKNEDTNNSSSSQREDPNTPTTTNAHHLGVSH